MILTKMMTMLKPAKILTLVRTNTNQVKGFSQLTRRLMALPYTTATDVLGPEQEESMAVKATMGDPCLDLYFLSDFDTPASYKLLNQLLPRAWSHNPLTTLKLICNLRDDWNDLGKADVESELESFYKAALWLHHNHPKTLAFNAASIAGEFPKGLGIMDYLVQILDRLLVQGGQDHPTRYEGDSDYRLLHDRVSDLFAEYLMSEIHKLKKQENFQRYELSSAAACCPPIGSSLCESIAKKVFPRECCPEFQGLEEADYAYRVQKRLKKEVLVPLNKFEMYAVPRQPGRPCVIKKYLEEVNVGSGNSKIEAGSLLPHEIIEYWNDADVGQAAKLQWKEMMEDMQDQGKFNNCLAVCNVSYPLFKLYVDVGVAFAVMVSQLSEEPWKGKVINFSANPELHNLALEGNGGDYDVMSKCTFLRSMDYGRTIDLHKVFDLILQVAVNGNLRPEQMIKKVFVFTVYDQFDMALATSSDWESDFEAIQNKFKEKGYGDAVPQVVFWGLDCCPRVVPPCRRPGVTIFGGFSNSLLKLFLDKDGEVGPHLVLEAAISGDQYQHMDVLD